MEYIRLGKSNLMVSRIAMGAMNLEKIGSEADSSGLIRQAYNSGVNFFDTARKCQGSEKTLGDAVYDIRQNVVVATKSDSDSSGELLESLVLVSVFPLRNKVQSWVQFYSLSSTIFLIY